MRNSFEAYDPLRELAHRLLDYKPAIILSSEWEFSPFTYPAISDDLPGFVFIGLPACEAGNALVLPLAGHELGHSIWRHGGVGASLAATINRRVFSSYLENPDDFKATFNRECTEEGLLNDPEALANLSLACRIAGRQCEEIFCDAVGVRLFAEAFIHSFEFLLAPSLGGDRSELYPPLQTRMTYMLKAAEVFRLSLEDQHNMPLAEKEPALPARGRLALKMADLASAQLFLETLQNAQSYCDERSAPKVAASAIESIEKAFRNYVPAERAESFTNVINATWKIYKRFPSFAKEFSDRSDAMEILNSLAFKSLEVLEYETKVGSCQS